MPPPVPASGPQDHYFSTAPAGPDGRRELRVHLGGSEAVVHTAPGVFSAGRLDPGTAVLLDHVPDPPEQGDLLDLGCGWGPIALAMAARAPAATVWAVDVNPRAVALTGANARALGRTGVRAVAPAEVPDGVRFAAIWSNPPIRVGKAVLHELLLRWLPRLDAGAAAHLVVQRNLGADSLHRWLAEQDWDVDREASSRGYRVLAVRRGVRPSAADGAGAPSPGGAGAARGA